MQSSKLMTSLNFSNSKDKDKNNINICVANPIHTSSRCLFSLSLRGPLYPDSPNTWTVQARVMCVLYTCAV